MDRKQIDPERPHQPRPFDRDGHFSGQDYDRSDEAAMGRESRHDEAKEASERARNEAAALPPDNGQRAGFDPRTGAVYGSGIGAGGGQSGEDLDQDTASGDGPVITGAGAGKR